MSDWLLATWLVCQTVWDTLVFGATGYLVFWRGHSGWWFVMAFVLTYSPGIYKALYKRFGVAEEEQ